jgi:2-iminoacetate synthase
VIYDITQLGYIPSFCTACYRLGRTGEDFMDLAKPGLIKEHCQPNALSTYLEYLLDYASPQTRQAGERLIEQALQQMDSLTRRRTEAMLQKVQTGKRDVYC